MYCGNICIKSETQSIPNLPETPMFPPSMTKNRQNPPTIPVTARKKSSSKVFDVWFTTNLKHFPEYKQLFVQYGINDIDLFDQMDDEILQWIGIEKIVHRKFILTQMKHKCVIKNVTTLDIMSGY